MKQNLSIIRGTTQSINIFIKTIEGLDYEIEENEIIRFGVKKRYNDPNAEYLTEKEMTKKDQCEDGSYIFVISPADTMSKKQLAAVSNQSHKVIEDLASVKAENLDLLKQLKDIREENVELKSQMNATRKMLNI